MIDTSVNCERGRAIYLTISRLALKFKSYPNFLNVSNKHNSSEIIMKFEEPGTEG